MQFYRLVKPIWGIEFLANKQPNPKFKEKIHGKNTIEGANFSKEELREWNEKGYNVYWFPNHPSTDVYSDGVRHLRGNLIDTFSYVFVDMDLKDEVYESKEQFLEILKEFPTPPTMVVDSGNGVHAYWAIEDLTRDRYVFTQQALLRHFNTDHSVFTTLQLMRVPGYNNTKRHEDYVKCKVIKEMSSGELHRWRDLPKEIFQNLTPEDKKRAQNHLDKLDGKNVMAFAEDIDLDELPEKFKTLLEKHPKIAELFENPSKDGDRSAADMSLANWLYSKDFDFKDCFTVIYNGQKAREKGIHRFEYTQLTVEKVYSTRSDEEETEGHDFKIENATQFLRKKDGQVKQPQVMGSDYLDYKVLGEPWRKHELLGIIAGAGIGKTSFALNIVRDIIENNPDSDEVYVFFSLEMSKDQIISRWVELVGAKSKLTDRLYVQDTQDANGMPLMIGLQEMYDYCTKLKKVTGRGIGAIIIDHFHIIGKHINPNKQPNFGINSAQGTGYGNNRNLSMEGMADQLKPLVKTLDTFGIVLTQTTKGKGIGDIPLYKEACHGVSNYEWIMDRILTIWQPLMRIQDITPIRYLSFQYAKIREKRENDRIKELQPKLLTYDMVSGKLKPTNKKEYDTFLTLLPTANEARKRANGNDAGSYDIQELGGAEEVLSEVTE